MKIKEKFFKELKKKIMPYFEKGKSHDFSHTERVFNIALELSKEENVDLDVIKASALLHDIARDKEDCGEIECHAEEGSKMAEKILKQVHFPENKIDKVIDCISTHRGSKNLKAKSKEGEILQDADRLDALGCIGIGRGFIRSVEKKRSIRETLNHYFEKFLKNKPNKFNTSKGKSVAKERYEYLRGFIDRFIKELDGEL